VPASHPHWYHPAQLEKHIKPEVYYWLTRPGALTSGLREIGPLCLSINREYDDVLGEDEAALMGCRTGAAVWAREITIAVSGQPCMVARSVCLRADSTGTWQAIRDLGTQPLADILYHDPAVSRGPFFICLPVNPQPIFAAVSHALTQEAAPAQMTENLKARSSVFWRAEHPLLVSECFLPAFWTLIRPQS